MKEDNISFLADILETLDSPLASIVSALERYKHTGVESSDLSLATQIGLRVALTRRLFTDSFDYISRARHYLDLPDFLDLLTHTIIPAQQPRQAGGQERGPHPRRQDPPEIARIRRDVSATSACRRPGTSPRTPCSTSSITTTSRTSTTGSTSSTDQIRQEYPHIVQVFKNSRFPPEIVQGLSMALDDLGDRPLIVRSSSLLEDRSGSAFSGKYKSLFLANSRGEAGAPRGPPGRDRRGLRLRLRSRSHRVPRRARTSRPSRGDGDHDPGGGRNPGRAVLPAGLVRRGLQQQRVPLVSPDPAGGRTRPACSRPGDAGGGSGQRRLPGPHRARPAGAAGQRHAGRGGALFPRSASMSSTWRPRPSRPSR